MMSLAQHVLPADAKPHADYYNRVCQCATLDGRALTEELSRQLSGSADSLRIFMEGYPNFFSESVVFVDGAVLRRQAEVIAAVERLVSMPRYQERVLAHAPESAHFTPNAHGVFLSYDFHLGEGGPRLIEINTNAGGGLLNALLARVQKDCGDLPAGEGCVDSSVWLDARAPEEAFMAMFLAEWRAERGDEPLRSIAIVDEQPREQFLFPEFLLFQRLFQRHGIEALICDPSELELRGGALWFESHRIDLVYNRLTDFGLDSPANACLREAYLGRGVVLTPHPRSHALYADKRNLALMTNEAFLDEIGVNELDRNLLMDGIARTFSVCPDAAHELWSGRRRLFFKPVAGYAGKGAYRGDKLTRRVFEEILKSDYVAQDFVPPGERLLNVAGEPAQFKFDVRHYVYRNQTQLTTARLYQGQTTNFRTPGGGFAPVMAVV